MKPAPMICKQCKAKQTKHRVISQRGLCRKCSQTNIREWAEAMKTRSGPNYEKWLAGCIGAAELTARQLAAEAAALEDTEQTGT